MEPPDSTESWTDGRWSSQSEAAPATGTPAPGRARLCSWVAGGRRSAADSRLQQRFWALAVCGLGPNSDDKGVRGWGEKGKKIFILL